MLAVCKTQTTSLMTSLANKNDSKLAFIESELDLRKCLKGTLVSKLVKQNKSVSMKVVLYLLTRLNDQFNMNLKFNDSQLTTLSFDILSVFQNETLEDLVMFLKLGRLGKLGGKLHRLDSHVILNEWLPIYLEMKLDTKDMVLKEQKEKFAIDLKSKVNWSEDSKKNLSNILSQFDDKPKQKDVRTKDYLDNSEDMILKFIEDIKDMDLDQLKKLKKFYKARRGQEIYKKCYELIKVEIKLINKE